MEGGGRKKPSEWGGSWRRACRGHLQPSPPFFPWNAGHILSLPHPPLIFSLLVRGSPWSPSVDHRCDPGKVYLAFWGLLFSLFVLPEGISQGRHCLIPEHPADMHEVCGEAKQTNKHNNKKG